MPALTWLRAHRRAALELVAVLVALAAGWALHRPEPRIEYREKVVYRERDAAHVEQVAKAETHATSDAVASASLAAHHRVHRHRVITTAPDGSSTDTRDTIVDDGLTLEAAQEVVVQLQTASLVLGALDVSREVEARRQAEVVQMPAAPPSLRLWGEVGAQAGLPPKPYGSVGAGVRLGEVPLLPAQLWLAGEGRFRPAQAPEVRVGLRVEIGP